MATDTDVRPGTEQSMTGLVSGIVGDVQELIRQQFAMLKAETREDMRRVAQASIGIGVGAALALFGGIGLTFMLAHLLSWAAGPDLPLWACYGIVGGLLFIGGLFLGYRGYAELTSFNPLPDKTAQALKENVQWTTASTTAPK